MTLIENKGKIMKIKIGTSGYSYQDWIGPYYPEGIKKGDMLPFYTQDFNCVEINFTYYQEPNPFVFYHLNKKTPNNFEFFVKLHQNFTHKREYEQDLVIKMKEAMNPIIESNKFIGFLAQFPYSFKYSKKSLEYLKRLADNYREFQLFLEFRHISWENDKLFEFMRQNKLNYVNVDEPDLKGLLPPQDNVTGDIAYIRFHGRNTKNWWQGTNEERYDYLYSAGDLDKWLINISKILKKSYKTYIFFNNHPQGKAIKNARMMDNLIKKNILNEA